MATDGQERACGFPRKGTLAVTVAIGMALAASRLVRSPGPPAAVGALPARTLAAIERNEPAFRVGAYDPPLLGTRVALWAERSYLTRGERREWLERIEAGVAGAERSLARTLADEYGRGTRIHCFVRGGAFISHTLGGYDQGRVRQPVVFLSFAHEGRAPHVHESVHVLAPDWSALWLREGLAVLLSRRLSHSPMLMRFGRETIDLNGGDARALARTCLASEAGRAAWRLVGQDGVPSLDGPDVRTCFYVLSGTLVETLERSLGRDALMAVYRSRRPAAALSQRSGRSAEAWKVSLRLESLVSAPSSARRQPAAERRGR